MNQSINLRKMTGGRTVSGVVDNRGVLGIRLSLPSLVCLHVPGGPELQ
jgi:hypothetical protein